MDAPFDLIVVGAGHAGCEAAAAAARMGGRVAVVTMSLAAVAQLPCNPAMGGVGKGHLIAELDALGGVQGWATDRAGIQFRVLNRSRGSAVWGPRVQCDKAAYANRMRRLLCGLAGVTVIEGEVTGLLAGDSAVTGVLLAGGERLACRSVVVTTGTFLGGLLHTGEERRPGGRFGEAPAGRLGAALGALGLRLRRFKTGTPPRLHRDSLDYERMNEQRGDPAPRPLSWRSAAVANRASCWVTRTPREAAEIVRANLDRAPLFTGAISGVGPRYCPSIEDKVVRFPHHEEHTLFLEPEGRNVPSMYVNGLSTSLPREVQEKIVRAVPGLENAAFLRYGYAVEYDVLAPGQLGHDMRVRAVPGLWLAGQVVGTSGYEEAAVQGFVAGVNALRAARAGERFVLGREAAYAGVLIDDLVTREHSEPYRMLTSRAEHRLILGVDSARERLMAHGVALGLVPEGAFHVEQGRWERRRRAVEELERAPLNPDAATRNWLRSVAGVDLVRPTTVAGLLRRQDVPGEVVAEHLPGLACLDREDRDVVLSRIRYAGYVGRHQREAERVRRLRRERLPGELLAMEVPGLSREVVEALRKYRPGTLAEAERLPGMTSAAMAILAGWVARAPRRVAKRSAGGAGNGGVFEPAGGETGSAARQVPGGEKRPPAPVDRAMQPRGGEEYGLGSGRHGRR